MGNKKINMHGIISQDQEDIHLENIKRTGYTIFKGLISNELVLLLKLKLNDCYEKQLFEIGGIDKLISIQDHDIARSLFAYNEIFLNKVIMHSILLKYLNILLDNSFILYSQVGVISRPNSELYQSAWHREIQYQHFTSSKPLAVQTLFVLDSFNSETGGTFLLPYSHLFENFPSNAFVETNEIQPILEPGDVIMMNSMLYHRAGFNTSTNNRLLITNTFVRPILTSQFNHSKMIDEKKLNDKEKEILGFRWNSNFSMIQWRLNRLINYQTNK